MVSCDVTFFNLIITTLQLQIFLSPWYPQLSSNTNSLQSFYPKNAKQNYGSFQTLFFSLNIITTQAIFTRGITTRSMTIGSVNFAPSQFKIAFLKGNYSCTQNPLSNFASHTNIYMFFHSYCDFKSIPKNHLEALWIPHKKLVMDRELVHCEYLIITLWNLFFDPKMKIFLLELRCILSSIYYKYCKRI